MTPSSTDTELSLVRPVDAPQIEVWKLWTEPSRLARWWWPERFQTQYRVELKPGGTFRYTTVDVPGLGVLDLAGTFLDVEPFRRLHYTWRWGNEPDRESKVAVEFVEAGSSFTEIHVKHAELKDQEDRDNHIVGWNDCLDRLQALV